ncbi:bifunctional UDP-N-acetylmuramoyl-tripeptide:D-alanyl-D-alanine ligase/alanine racemase [Algoriphagus sp. C2-6-M1]|uniref:bifunctional UDP-N-acetylmuramoyl-tripeptide:D-alanyl-D-alanine ligase/alanine racemase n=1 Tax=Algoriphagus persicinus TaxID=3108754 RepID=UPI002B3A805F|nr:bifunctional UDP-N-acetylmuramoyl-tripeptide:D-alanyl-D-alanine ligase/alanine racemase [Algoriphagus sp. C2-6-M1]MEB2778912.1 bifunctional UDP-N-acetylmuramoyl-tripeptide:D-alanyl-D-alanine ligase/alanine racemase [Algoriphagus sp. C2-6-M1]
MFQEISQKQIAEITKGSLVNGNDDLWVSQIAIDSRQILHPDKTLFIALRGAKADGVDFIAQLVALGVKTFLVHLDFEGLSYPEVSFIQVSDTRRALQLLAKYQRKLFTKPVVSITGSNGKTIVKEWLGQILGQKYAVAKSPKSYNSQVGVPLSIFGIEPYHQVAILEAGISKAGEMSALQEMIEPDLGIFTNLGTAHQEGFGSLESKLEEKLSLFEDASFLVYCTDQKEVSKQIEARFSVEKLVGWSDRSGAEFTRSVKVKTPGARLILMKSDLSTHTFQVPFTDVASLENITHVIVAAMTLGQSASSIEEGIAQLKSVDMRLTLKPGINDSLLIDDTYNNDLAGLKVALDFMQQQRAKRRKILILSDLLQQGSPEIIYGEVAELIKKYQFDQLIGVGKEIYCLAKVFPESFRGFSSTSELLSSLDPESFQNDLILVTGARVFGFEEVVNRLQQRLHGTTLEINLNALTHNYNFYKMLISPKTKVMVMVKAFAYGGGAVEIANQIQMMGADYLGVAFSDEGVALRKQGIRLPILVLNTMQESFGLCSEFDLEPVVFSPEFFESLATWCSIHKKQMKIHLDLDTGMHRLGFERKQLGILKELIQSKPHLEIASIYTHLVGADEEIHREFSMEQMRNFEEMKNEILAIIPYKPLIHALNSAGIVAFPEFQFDMVRLGIGLYGVEVTGRHELALRAISTLRTTISQIKELDPGETIGYSRKGVLASGGKIATLAIGYADGYDRRFSNGKGYVLINGQKAYVIGNVCMDMCMVDVSGMNVKAGDEAIVYGEKISLKELADQIGTIPYELLTNISTRVKRVYYLD